MTKDNQTVRSSATGLGCAEPSANSPSSKSVPPTNGDQLSSRSLSTLKRLFDAQDDGMSCFGLIASSRLLKFLVVGSIGVVVNLVVMALLIQAGYSGWRASAIASAVATLHNYLLNNHWTYSDRRRNGRALLNGAFLYLPMAAVGIAITTVSYSILLQFRFRTTFGTSSLYLLGAQLVSILFGTHLNYRLHNIFTWRLSRNHV